MRTPAFLIAALLTLAPSGATATPAEQAFRWGGETFTCQAWDGRWAVFQVRYDLETIGRAYRRQDLTPVIEVNPAQLSMFSTPVAQWWVAHECAHHQLRATQNTERRADCIAAQWLARKASVLGTELDTFHAELNSLQGDSTHDAGAERAATVKKCGGARFASAVFPSTQAVQRSLRQN